MKEIDLRASDASEAVRDAARLDWPPSGAGFRLTIAHSGAPASFSPFANADLLVAFTLGHAAAMQLIAALSG